MVSAYLALLGVLAAERLIELRVSRRHEAWARAAGAREYGREHFRWMKLLHGAFFLACAGEVLLLERAFYPPLGIPMLFLLAAAQGLRYWTISTLGRRWSVRVLVIPGAPLVESGPYRYIRHPNYLAVVLEMASLPLIHSAWVTALVFSSLNALLLRVRIRCEEEALSSNNRYQERLAGRGRFIPSRAVLLQREILDGYRRAIDAKKGADSR
jgi:methyltransferase